MYNVPDDQILSFQRRGYSIIRDHFDQAAVRRLRAVSDELAQRALAILEQCERDGISPAIVAATRPKELIVVQEAEDPRMVCRYEYMIGCSPVFSKIIETAVRPAVTSMLGEAASVFKDKTNEKLPGGGAFGPHQDFVAYQHFGPRYNVTALISIHPSTAENGCVQFATNFLELTTRRPDFVSSTIGGRHILHHEIGGRNNGDILPEIAAHLEWDEVEVGPQDLVVFDSFVPHYSKPNLSSLPRRAVFVTFNGEREGQWYERYYKDKRANYHNPKFHISTPTVHRTT